jgi:hypothetical protein
MTNPATVLVGSALSAIVAVFVVSLRSSLERRDRLQMERAERLAGFLSASYAVAMAIGRRDHRRGNSHRS